MEDADNTIILVDSNDDERKLIFDIDCVESIKTGESVPLKVSNHTCSGRKYLGFFQEPKYDDKWGAFRCLALVDEANTTWLHEEKWVSTTLEDKNNYVLGVNYHKMEKENPIWLIRQKLQKETKTGIDGRLFIFNDDNTVSPKDRTNFVLGRRGRAQSKQQKLVDAIRFKKDEGTVDSLLGEVVAASLVDTLVEADTTCALAEAIEVNNLKAVNSLLQNGANINLKKGLKFTPFQVALWSERDAIINSIIKSIPENGKLPGELPQDAISAISVPMTTGNVKNMISVLDKLNIDIDEAFIKAMTIENGSVECAEELIKRGANLNKAVGDEYLQKKIKTGPNFVSIILQAAGDFNMKEIKEEKHKEFVVAQYARLDVTTLSRCAARSITNYKSKEPEKKEDYNPLLKCMILAREAKRFWRRERRTNPTQAHDLKTLHMRLQLCAAAMMEEIHHDDLALGGDDGEIRKEVKKEQKLIDFWKKESTEEALKTARDIESHTFFSQPLVHRTISEFWYKGDDDEAFVGRKSDFWERLKEVGSFVARLIFQLPLIPFQGYLLWRKHHEYRCDGEGRVKFRFIITRPIFMFIVQSIIDLAFAILFTIFDATSLAYMRDKRLWALFLWLFAVISVLALEARDAVKCGNHFIDRFNLLDLPGLILAAISLTVTLLQSSVVLTEVLSLTCIFMWLRMLRVLTLVPEIGPLTLMIFKMIRKMLVWSTLLLWFVFAFASGVSKLNFSGDAICSKVTRTFTPRVFFEEIISPSGDLFDCEEPRTITGGVEWGFSFGSVIIWLSHMFGNVMLINMLIAIMGESFSSVWEAQEATYDFQLAIHYFKMKERKYLPIPCLYLPYGLYEVFCFKFCPRTCPHKHQDIEPEDMEPGGYAFFKKDEEDRLTADIAEYVSKHQNEASEEDHWRFSMAEKGSSMDKKIEMMDEKIVMMEKKIEDMDNKMEKMLDILKKRYGEGGQTSD